MAHPVSRRTLLGGAAGAAAALALPDLAGAQRAPRGKRTADVVVVGAGLSGLVAARQLAAKGRRVVVVEARDRVGGRTLNHALGDGVVTESGGQFVGPTQDRLLALAKAVGVATFPTYNEGSSVQVWGGERTLYSAALGVPNGDVGQVFLEAIPKLDAMAREVPPAAPWKAKRAAEWDAMTLAQWMAANIAGDGQRRSFEIGLQPLLGAEPEEVSFLFFLWYIAQAGNAQSAGSAVRLFSTPGGAQERRFAGGSHRIALELARALGSRIVLAAPVRTIRQDDDGVVVTAGALEVHAKRAIVAMSPLMAGRLTYGPRLPSKHDALRDRMPNGNLAKASAVYDRPFWRAAGLSGQSVADVGPVTTTFDNTPPGGTPGILMGFIGGSEHHGWAARPAAQRRSAALASFARLFGDEALTPRAYTETDWAEERWTRGCPVAHAGPRVLTRYGATLAQPFRRVHWAGTETADYWAGYMDGAVRAGERAAREVLAALRRR